MTMKTEIIVICVKCKVPTSHIILKSEEDSGSIEGHDIFYYESWEIIQCRGCKTISFRQTSYNSTDINPDNGDPRYHEKLYPIRNENTLPIKPYYNLPNIVRNTYRETMDAFNYGLLLLCNAGLRAIIEAICNHEGILDGPVDLNSKDDRRSNKLNGRINGLYEKGIITKKQALSLHEHRFLGNEALHDLEVPPIGIVRVAIELIEHVLDIYEHDGKYAELSWWRFVKSKK